MEPVSQFSRWLKLDNCGNNVVYRNIIMSQDLLRHGVDNGNSLLNTPNVKSILGSDAQMKYGYKDSTSNGGKPIIISLRDNKIGKDLNNTSLNYDISDLSVELNKSDITSNNKVSFYVSLPVIKFKSFETSSSDNLNDMKSKGLLELLHRDELFADTTDLSMESMSINLDMCANYVMVKEDLSGLTYLRSVSMETLYELVDGKSGGTWDVTHDISYVTETNTFGYNYRGEATVLSKKLTYNSSQPTDALGITKYSTGSFTLPTIHPTQLKGKKNILAGTSQLNNYVVFNTSNNLSLTTEANGKVADLCNNTADLSKVIQDMFDLSAGAAKTTLALKLNTSGGSGQKLSGHDADNSVYLKVDTDNITYHEWNELSGNVSSLSKYVLDASYNVLRKFNSADVSYNKSGDFKQHMEGLSPTNTDTPTNDYNKPWRNTLHGIRGALKSSYEQVFKQPNLFVKVEDDGSNKILNIVKDSGLHPIIKSTSGTESDVVLGNSTGAAGSVTDISRLQQNGVDVTNDTNFNFQQDIITNTDYNAKYDAICTAVQNNKVNIITEIRKYEHSFSDASLANLFSGIPTLAQAAVQLDGAASLTSDGKFANLSDKSAYLRNTNEDMAKSVVDTDYKLIETDISIKKYANHTLYYIMSDLLDSVVDDDADNEVAAIDASFEQWTNDLSNVGWDNLLRSGYLKRGNDVTNGNLNDAWVDGKAVDDASLNPFRLTNGSGVVDNTCGAVNNDYKFTVRHIKQMYVFNLLHCALVKEGIINSGEPIHVALHADNSNVELSRPVDQLSADIQKADYNKSGELDETSGLWKVVDRSSNYSSNDLSDIDIPLPFKQSESRRKLLDHGNKVFDNLHGYCKTTLQVRPFKNLISNVETTGIKGSDISFVITDVSGGHTDASKSIFINENEYELDTNANFSEAYLADVLNKRVSLTNTLFKQLEDTNQPAAEFKLAYDSTSDLSQVDLSNCVPLGVDYKDYVVFLVPSKKTEFVNMNLKPMYSDKALGDHIDLEGDELGNGHNLILENNDSLSVIDLDNSTFGTSNSLKSDVKLGVNWLDFSGLYDDADMSATDMVFNAGQSKALDDKYVLFVHSVTGGDYKYLKETDVDVTSASASNAYKVCVPKVSSGMDDLANNNLRDKYDLSSNSSAVDLDSHPNYDFVDDISGFDCSQNGKVALPSIPQGYNLLRMSINKLVIEEKPVQYNKSDLPNLQMVNNVLSEKGESKVNDPNSTNIPVHGYVDNDLSNVIVKMNAESLVFDISASTNLQGSIRLNNTSDSTFNNVNDILNLSLTLSGEFNAGSSSDLTNKAILKYSCTLADKDYYNSLISRPSMRVMNTGRFGTVLNSSESVNLDEGKSVNLITSGVGMQYMDICNNDDSNLLGNLDLLYTGGRIGNCTLVFESPNQSMLLDYSDSFELRHNVQNIFKYSQPDHSKLNVLKYTASKKYKDTSMNKTIYRDLDRPSAFGLLNSDPNYNENTGKSLHSDFGLDTLDLLPKGSTSLSKSNWKELEVGNNHVPIKIGRYASMIHPFVSESSGNSYRSVGHASRKIMDINGLKSNVQNLLGLDSFDYTLDQIDASASIMSDVCHRRGSMQLDIHSKATGLYFDGGDTQWLTTHYTRNKTSYSSIYSSLVASDLMKLFDNVDYSTITNSDFNNLKTGTGNTTTFTKIETLINNEMNNLFMSNANHNLTSLIAAEKSNRELPVVSATSGVNKICVTGSNVQKYMNPIWPVFGGIADVGSDNTERVRSRNNTLFVTQDGSDVVLSVQFVDVLFDSSLANIQVNKTDFTAAQLAGSTEESRRDNETASDPKSIVTSNGVPCHWTIDIRFKGVGATVPTGNSPKEVSVFLNTSTNYITGASESLSDQCGSKALVSAAHSTGGTSASTLAIVDSLRFYSVFVGDAQTYGSARNAYNIGYSSNVLSTLGGMGQSKLLTYTHEKDPNSQLYISNARISAYIESSGNKMYNAVAGYRSTKKQPNTPCTEIGFMCPMPLYKVRLTAPHIVAVNGTFDHLDADSTLATKDSMGSAAGSTQLEDEQNSTFEHYGLTSVNVSQFVKMRSYSDNNKLPSRFYTSHHVKHIDANSEGVTFASKVIPSVVANKLKDLSGFGFNQSDLKSSLENKINYDISLAEYPSGTVAANAPSSTGLYIGGIDDGAGLLSFNNGNMAYHNDPVSALGCASKKHKVIEHMVNVYGVSGENRLVFGDEINEPVQSIEGGEMYLITKRRKFI